MQIASYLFLGLVGGFFGGAFGLGGGSIMVPALVLIFGLSQLQAQGTTLAVLLPPVFILAVWRYYVAGNVKVAMACYIALGFVVGALVGAHLVQGVADVVVKRSFGVLLILIGIKMAVFK